MDSVAFLCSLVAIATLNSHFRLEIRKRTKLEGPHLFLFDKDSIVLGSLNSIFHVEFETIWTWQLFYVV